MKKILPLVLCGLLFLDRGHAQSLPANTCGIVYAYDAGGNRTQRKYLCNNSQTAYTPTSNSLKSLTAVAQVSTLYPNPTTGRFTVAFTRPLDKARVSVVDMSGRLLQQVIKSGAQLQFDFSAYPAGLYLIQILDGNNVITQKVVKQ